MHRKSVCRQFCGRKHLVEEHGQPAWSWQEVCSNWNNQKNIPKCTTHWYLRWMSYSRRPHRLPLLSAKNRLQCSQAHWNRTVEDWKKKKKNITWLFYNLQLSSLADWIIVYEISRCNYVPNKVVSECIFTVHYVLCLLIWSIMNWQVSNIYTITYKMRFWF